MCTDVYMKITNVWKKEWNIQCRSKKAVTYRIEMADRERDRKTDREGEERTKKMSNES